MVCSSKKCKMISCCMKLTYLCRKLDASSWIQVHQYLGSDSELRKSSGLSEDAHQSNQFCVMSCLSFVNSCSHRQVLPNTEAASSWGIMSGIKGAKKKTTPQRHILPLVCRSITSIWRFKGPLSTTTAYGLPNNSNLLFSAESLQISGWRQHRACWVLWQTAHTASSMTWSGSTETNTSSFAASVPRTGSAWFWKPCSEPWTLSEFTFCWTLTMLGEGVGVVENCCCSWWVNVQSGTYGPVVLRSPTQSALWYW